MNRTDLLAAICLVFVLEGLFPLLAPRAWKRALARLLDTPENALRIGGGMMILTGLVALQLLRVS
ncbi:MAG TPA: DUF2065 family protein [Xanthomonadaceae bacterium]|jgi:hypothetical protein